MIIVYAITSTDIGRMTGRGIAREKLRALRVGHVVAVVGELHSTPDPIEANLRKYDRVMRAISQRASALLPVRFGTTVRDLDELTLILGARQKVLRARLKAVRNRAQMTVRVVMEPGSGIRDPGSETRDVEARDVEASGSRGTGYLRARARAATLPEFAPIRVALTRWIRGERVEKRGTVATIYHLVPRASAETYRRALEATARATGVRLLVSGPFPPYAFADPLAP